MPLKPWPIVTDGEFGKVPMNWFPAQDSSQQLILLPFGGLEQFSSFTNCTEVRAGWAWNDYTYWLARRGNQSVFFRVDGAGVAVELGYISTSFTGPAWIRNNATQLCVVDGVSGYVFTPSTGVFAQISDADFPGASCLEYQDGYGIVAQPNTNKWFFSQVNDFTSWDALDYYSKESTTDNIRTIRSFSGELYVFGTEKGSEIWYNAGGDNSSIQTPTFARYPGGLINEGAASARSDTDMSGVTPTFLNTKGQLMQAMGTQVKVVSNQMFNKAVRGGGTPFTPGYAKFDDAIAFSFEDQNHIFHQVTFPSADETWVYDMTTQMIIQRQSWKAAGGYGRHRANCYCLYNGKHLIGDFENGKVYEMSVNFYDDAGQNIQRYLYTKDVISGLKPVFWPNVQVSIQPGQGLPGGTTPQMGLEFSGDGGSTWSNMVNRSAGLVGETKQQANWYQMGSSFRRAYRLTVTDPIYWVVLGLEGFV